MEINKQKNGSSLVIALKGRLDTLTAPQLEKELALDGVTSLVFDMTELEYISSAGLRVMLTAQKTMMLQGEMALEHVIPVVREVFEMTGLAAFFTIR